MFRRAFRTSPSHDRRWLKRLGPIGLASALVIAPLALLPSPAASDVPTGSADVSAAVTTNPADANVYRVDTIRMDNSTNPCSSGGSFKTPGGNPLGEHVVAPGVTVSVTGDKTDGYTVEIDDTIDGEARLVDVYLKGAVDANSWYHFHPSVLSATPLFTSDREQEARADASHMWFCYDITGTLTITKNVVDAAGGTFSFTVNCGDYALESGDAAFSLLVVSPTVRQHLIDGLPLGTRCTVSETDPGASTWTTSYRINGGAPQNALTTSAVTIGAQNTTVAYTNTRKTGTLTVVKELAEGDLGVFDLLIDGSIEANDVGDGGTTGEVTVNTGAHTVAEAAGANTILADYTPSTVCLDGAVSVAISGAGSVIIGEDQDVVCTITNTRLTGSLTVSKTTNAAGTFTFDVVCTNGLVQVITITTGDSDAQTINGIPTRTSCTVTERSNPLFSPSVLPLNGTVEITTLGQTVAFTNTRLTGPLTITKTAIGGTGTFTFDVDCTDNAFDQVISIEDGNSRTITGIPTTTTCTVTERSDPLFTSSVLPVNGTVTIDAGGQNVAFVNTAIIVPTEVEGVVLVEPTVAPAAAAPVVPLTAPAVVAPLTELPRTGGPLQAQTQAALAFIGAGLVLALAGRRRWTIRRAD